MSVSPASVSEILDMLEQNNELRHRLFEMLQPSVQRPKISYEEFLEWADEDTLAEWVDGAIVMTSPASFENQELVNFLVSTMRTFVESRQLGIVLSAPFQMKLQRSGREPDVLFLRNEHRDRLKPTYLDGPADLVIEVVSPESVSRDRGEKFVEYEQASIPEYWLIDPLRRVAECYRLDDNGRYQTLLSGESGVFHSTVVPGFWVRLEWFWQPPLVLDALRDLGLVHDR